LVTLAVIYSRTILSFVYGQQYSAVAVPFSLLFVYVLLLIEGSVLGNVLFGIGQPGKHRAFVGLRALILVLFMYPAIKMFGLTGAAAVLCFASFVALCLQVTVLHKVIGLRAYDYAISWLPGFIMSLVILSISMVS
jgi:O-antigen/teichoic acid export membrane protein